MPEGNENGLALRTRRRLARRQNPTEIAWLRQQSLALIGSGGHLEH